MQIVGHEGRERQLGKAEQDGEQHGGEDRSLRAPLAQSAFPRSGVTAAENSLCAPLTNRTPRPRAHAAAELREQCAAVRPGPRRRRDDAGGDTLRRRRSLRWPSAESASGTRRWDAAPRRRRVRGTLRRRHRPAVPGARQVVVAVLDRQGLVIDDTPGFRFAHDRVLRTEIAERQPEIGARCGA